MIVSDQKTETLNLRVSMRVKDALRQAASKERRSMANMVEFLVLSYCETHGLDNMAARAERATPSAENLYSDTSTLARPE